MAHPLQALIERAGFETRSYSGRGMYGKNCVGVVIERGNGGPICSASIGKFIAELVNAAVADVEATSDEVLESRPFDSDMQIYDNLRRMQQDSMGLDTIVYFPGVEYVSDETEDE